MVGRDPNPETGGYASRPDKIILDGDVYWFRTVKYV